jgi:hypothetical protein
MAGGGVHQGVSHYSPSIQHVVLTAYRTGFSTTLNHLMIIAAIVALVGSIGGFVLVRQRDFVVPGGPGAPAVGHG